MKNLVHFKGWMRRQICPLAAAIVFYSERVRSKKKEKKRKKNKRSVNISEWQRNPLAEKEDLNWDLFLRVSICKCLCMHAFMHTLMSSVCVWLCACVCRQTRATICCRLIHSRHLISIWIDSCNADSFHPCYSWKQPITARTALQRADGVHVCVFVSFTHHRQCYKSPCIFNSSPTEL